MSGLYEGCDIGMNTCSVHNFFCEKYHGVIRRLAESQNGLPLLVALGGECPSATDIYCDLSDGILPRERRGSFGDCLLAVGFLVQTTEGSP